MQTLVLLYIHKRIKWIEERWLHTSLKGYYHKEKLYIDCFRHKQNLIPCVYTCIYIKVSINCGCMDRIQH